MRAARLMLIAFVALACGGGAPAATPAPLTTAATSAPPTTAAHSITAQVTIHDSGRTGLIQTGAHDCTGRGAYSDIGPGMQATIKNASGTILGVANFSTGTSLNVIGRDALACQLSATIPNVPDSDFYSVDLGRRGSIQFTKADLEAAGWIAGITIGQ